jgi:hypothetical protein
LDIATAPAVAAATTVAAAAAAFAAAAAAAAAAAEVTHATAPALPGTADVIITAAAAVDTAPFAFFSRGFFKHLLPVYSTIARDLSLPRHESELQLVGLKIIYCGDSEP